MKKSICIFAAVILLAASFAACSKTPDPQQEQTTVMPPFITAHPTQATTEILGGLALSGEWGDATWELFHSGELVFSGSGRLVSRDEDEETDWMPYGEYIKTIIINEGITEIGKNLFRSHSSLEKLSLPATLTLIEEQAFADCGKLREVALPDGVVTVEDYAFEDSGVEKIRLGASVAEFGPLAFSGCKVTDIRVSDDNPSFSVDAYGVLFNKDKTELIWFSNGFLMNSYSVPDGVKVIKEESFFNEYLAEITLPDGLEEIEKRAFAGCISLKAPEIPSTVTEIGSEAFADCRAIEEFAFPEGIEHIRSGVLSGCPNLKSVYLPKSVLTIGENAFGSQATFEINYDGSKEDWKKVSVAQGNAAVGYANKNYGI